MDYKFFKLDKFLFRDELFKEHWVFKIVGAPIIYPILKKLIPGFSPPGIFETEEENVSKTSNERYWLVRIGRAIGFDEPKIVDILAFHQRRLNIRNKFRGVIIGSVGIGAVFLVSKLLVSFGNFLELYLSDTGLHLYLVVIIQSLAIMILSLLYMYLIFFVVVGAAMKFTSIIVGKYFAETLCIEVILYLIIELSRDSVLSYSDRRKSLLLWTDLLAKNTLLLHSSFVSKDNLNQEWIRTHFRYLERYIRDRERWIVAPKNTTLADLRRDFYHLATIYITGNYGNFAWPDEILKVEISQQNRIFRLLATISRFAVGIVLPLLGLIVVVWQPALMESVYLDRDVIILVFVSWFLLAVDASLKLGIVAGIVDLAKGIKELS